MRGKIHGMAALKVSTVAMNDVPKDVPVKRAESPYRPLYEEICDLPRGQVKRVEFPVASLAYSVRASLRKMAKRDGEVLSSNKEPGGLVRFFWLEPKA